MPDDRDNADRDNPVSLAPLTPEEVLRALLAVKPEDRPQEVVDDDAGQRK